MLTDAEWRIIANAIRDSIILREEGRDISQWEGDSLEDMKKLHAKL